MKCRKNIPLYIVVKNADMFKELFYLNNNEEVIFLGGTFMDVYNNDILKHVYSPEDLANLVKDSAEYYKNQASRASAKAAKTREEVKAEIINEYETENSHLRDGLKRAVTILGSDAELRAYQDFCDAHENCRNSARINWGKSPYVIQTHNGIGISSEVICPICNEHKDITDCSNW